jgi:nitrite reductase (NO-forming)
MTRADRHLRANALVLAWLLAAAVVALLHRSVPGSGWLMVHLLLVGGVSTAILIWSQHFADTLIRRPGSPRGLTVRLALHTVGALGVIVGQAARRSRRRSGSPGRVAGRCRPASGTWRAGTWRPGCC